MLNPIALASRSDVVYPESDGAPMADNTRQLHWIILVVENLDALFMDRVDIFVAGDQNWYPVEGVTISMECDLLLGRLQWGWIFRP